MTDAELIQLVQEKAPEDLTPDEIGLLRTRLTDSSELRQVIYGQLQLEQTLSAALGRTEVSVDRIFATAVFADKPATRTAALFGWAFCLAVSLLGLVVLFLTTSNKPQIAEKNPTDARD